MLEKICCNYIGSGEYFSLLNYYRLCDVIVAALNPEIERGQVEVKGTEPIPPYYQPLGSDGKPAVFLKAKPKITKSLSCRGSLF